jgi:hypothetical protein
VDADELHEVVRRLRAKAIRYGNDPEAPSNIETSDLLGGGGRIYFVDPS